jgi:hypothetical protein
MRGYGEPSTRSHRATAGAVEPSEVICQVLSSENFSKPPTDFHVTKMGKPRAPASSEGEAGGIRCSNAARRRVAARRAETRAFLHASELPLLAAECPFLNARARSSETCWLQTGSPGAVRRAT